MKKQLLLLILFLLSSNIYSQEKLLASCCEDKDGRCTGSAYCSACSNCSRCKHCSAGGTCGVCYSYSAPVKKKSPSTNSSASRRSSSKKSSFKSSSEFDNTSFLIVKSKTLNVRTGPGTNYEVIEKLIKGDFLIYLSFEKDWIKVKVVDSGKEGYVYYKYVEQ